MASFSSFKIDIRILKAIEELGWVLPTEIQEKSLQHVLEGNDVLIRSKTGSGKTAIYIIAALQLLLTSDSKNIQIIVFVPSNELAAQVFDHFIQLSRFCADIKITNTSKTSTNENLNKYNIVIGTPSKIGKILESSHLKLTDSKLVVFDEADLLFSYGHSQILDKLATYFTHQVQSIILSATLNSDTEHLSSLVLRNAMKIISQEDPLPDSSQLSQYIIKCEMEDKYLIIYSFLFLKLIKGRTLIFVGNINSCYKLKLFLNSFSIKSLVLNGEMPVNSRLHILKEFNKCNTVLITTDDSSTSTGEDGKKTDQDFCVSRGLDFHNVENIINFDFPCTIQSYIHRVGRTARAQNIGMALSLVTPKEIQFYEELNSFLQRSSDHILKPFKFKLETVEGFRYRVEDVLKSITKSEVLNQRMVEIKNEMYNSKKLTEHFKNKPADKMALKKVANVSKNSFFGHLDKLPDYLIPKTMKNRIKPQLESSNGFVANKRDEYMKKRREKRNFKRDPLKCVKSKVDV